MTRSGALQAALLLSMMGAACQPSPRAAGTIDLDRVDLVDLTHPFNSRTIYWPTATTTFAHEQLAFGQTAGGYFYSAYAFSTPEHGGTHLDAPIHFADGGQTADAIPLAQLVAPAVVIDVSARTSADRDYLLSPGDLADFEAAHGTIEAGTIVLLRTGWSARWNDRFAYLGDSTPGSASNLHFPSFGADAARILVEERRVAALGADVASIDGGTSTDFLVHRIAAAANVPGFENLANLERLPAVGAFVIALPMKIEGGSGGPLRAIALVPR